MERVRLGVLDGATRFGHMLVGFLGDQGITADLHAEESPLLERLEHSALGMLVMHEPGCADLLTTLHRIRTVSRVPCIVIGDEADPDRSIGILEAGADDMMARETPLPIMLARMRAVLRRGAWGLAAEATRPAPAEKAATWRLIRPRRELFRPDGTECRLTTAEFDLFCLLVDSGPAAVSREEICLEVFRRRWRSEDRTVDNLVVRLRRKLDDEARTTIRTLQGRGYAFVGFDRIPLRDA